MKKIINILYSASCILVLGALGCGDKSGEFEYVAMGASDATGVGATPLDNGYVYKIQDALKSDGLDVGLINLGIPGIETDEMSKIELPAAIEEEPELVTVFAGANDIIAGISAEDFENDINEILSQLTEETPAVVVIATIPDLTQLPEFLSNPDNDVTTTRINQFNSIIRSAAARTGAHIADLALVPIDEHDVNEDGFHPNNTGHQRIADMFLAVIRPLVE